MSRIRTRREPCPRCGSARKVEAIAPESLREVRRAAAVSLRELGGRVGLSATYLSGVERGRRRVTDRVLGIYRDLEVSHAPAGESPAVENEPPGGVSGASPGSNTGSAAK